MYRSNKHIYAQVVDDDSAVSLAAASTLSKGFESDGKSKLEKARLVISRKEGRCRWNYLDVSPIQRIHERWISAYAAPSAGLLSRLQADLESA